MDAFPAKTHQNPRYTNNTSSSSDGDPFHNCQRICFDLRRRSNLPSLEWNLFRSSAALPSFLRPERAIIILPEWRGPYGQSCELCRKLLENIQLPKSSRGARKTLVEFSYRKITGLSHLSIISPKTKKFHKVGNKCCFDTVRVITFLLSTFLQVARSK
jgi:hypothetical protein